MTQRYIPYYKELFKSNIAFLIFSREGIAYESAKVISHPFAEEPCHFLTQLIVKRLKGLYSVSASGKILLKSSYVLCKVFLSTNLYLDHDLAS